MVGALVLDVFVALCSLAEVTGDDSLVARPLLDAELEDSTVSLIHRLGRQLNGAPARLLSLLENNLKSWTLPDAERE